jgi:hypothetical protein
MCMEIYSSYVIMLYLEIYLYACIEKKINPIIKNWTLL